MIDAIIHDATTVFNWLLAINTILILGALISAIERPQRYKLKRSK